jgi:hypothetical protein
VDARGKARGMKASAVSADPSIAMQAIFIIWASLCHPDCCLELKKTKTKRGLENKE